MEDILLHTDGTLKIENGDFVIGDSEAQEVQGILEMAKGELKEDPLLGADLYYMINSNASAIDLKTRVKLQLERDGKNYEKLKETISLNINE